MLSLIIFSLLLVTIHAELSEGDSCQLHTGETGYCVNSKDCKWLEQNLIQKTMTFDQIRRCSLESDVDIVCYNDRQPSIRNTVQLADSKCNPDFVFESHNCSKTAENHESNIIDEYLGTERTKSEIGNKVRQMCARIENLLLNNFDWFPITNGKVVKYYNEVHQMVALGYPDGQNGYEFDCGGALISEKWAVTAAHCITKTRKPVVARMKQLDLHERDGFLAIDRKISRIVRHPLYSSLRKKNDIALIEFYEYVEFDGDLYPACIHTDENDIRENVEMTIAGWGSIEASRVNRSRTLLKATVFTVPLDKCNQTFIEYNEESNQPSLRGLIKSQMCALNEETQSDACQGDSGGSLFVISDGLSTIHGIVSFGVSCSFSLPGIYTRIASYVNWIESIVWAGNKCAFDSRGWCPYPRKGLPQNLNSCRGCRVKSLCSGISSIVRLSSIDIDDVKGELQQMVSLGYPDGHDGLEFDCGGVLISEKWVVTAAHCVNEKREPIMVRVRERKKNQDLYSMILGDPTSSAIDRNISRIVRHPHYTRSWQRNDIALIEFNEIVRFNKFLYPACIHDDENDIGEDVPMTIASWGPIEAGRHSDRSRTLLKATVVTVPLEECNRECFSYFQQSNQPHLHNTQMCAHNGKINSSACQGDSGGALFFKGNDNTSTVYGIASTGVNCGTSLPGVFTRIASHVDWIESILWPDKEWPSNLIDFFDFVYELKNPTAPQ